MRSYLLFSLSFILAGACIFLTPKAPKLDSTPPSANSPHTAVPTNAPLPLIEILAADLSTPSPKTPPTYPPSPSLTPSSTPTETPPPWLGYPGPITTPATAVPPPLDTVTLPPEIDVLVLRLHLAVGERSGDA